MFKNFGSKVIECLKDSDIKMFLSIGIPMLILTAYSYKSGKDAGYAKACKELKKAIVEVNTD